MVVNKTNSSEIKKQTHGNIQWTMMSYCSLNKPVSCTTDATALLCILIIIMYFMHIHSGLYVCVCVIVVTEAGEDNVRSLHSSYDSLLSD